MAGADDRMETEEEEEKEEEEEEGGNEGNNNKKVTRGGLSCNPSLLFLGGGDGSVLISSSALFRRYQHGCGSVGVSRRGIDAGDAGMKGHQKDNDEKTKSLAQSFLIISLTKRRRSAGSSFSNLSDVAPASVLWDSSRSLVRSTRLVKFVQGRSVV